MKLAVVGSRSIKAYDLSSLIPEETTEIISGGAVGVDTLAEQYARRHNLKLTVFLPEYDLYGRRAPFIRNRFIVEECDEVLALWDGISRGTMFTVGYAEKIGKPVHLHRFHPKPKDSKQISFW